MAVLPRRRKKRLVLDIGASSVRLCELAQTKTGFQLTRYMQRDYNADPTLDEETKRKLRKDALAALLKESKIRTRKTIFAVPGQSVFTRTRSLPPVPEYKVNQIVRYEIQQQIPFSLDQIAMDYQVLNRSEAGGYDVLMAAIKVDVVDKQVEVLEANKRSIDIVDVSPIAAYNWLKHTGEFGDQAECVALVDIGAATTDIVVERENQFRFTRPLNVGGNDITRAIASAFNVSFLEAEKIKRERGFAPTGDPEKDGKGGEVIGTVLQRLVTEIMRSFAYFRSLPGGGPINRVILCGGGACLRNIVPYMQRQLGMEVRIAQPLAGLAIAPGAQQVSERPEQACVVLGLALRCCQPATIEINLIPPRVLEARRRREQAMYWAMSLATLGLIMASVIPVSAAKNEATKQRIEVLKRAIGAYDPEKVFLPGGSPPSTQAEERLRQAQNEINRLQNEVKQLDLARDSRRYWLDEIALLNDARPTTGGARVFFRQIESSVLAPPGGTGGPRNAPGPAPGGGGLRGLAAGVGGFGGFGGDAGRDIVNATPFPGIAPAALGGPGGMRIGGGGPPGRGGAQGQAQGPTVDLANGLTIHGFAENDKVLKEFIDNLDKAERTTSDGTLIETEKVYFSEASVAKHERGILWNAPPPPMPRSESANYAADSVYSFTVYVQLRYSGPGSGIFGNTGRQGGRQGMPQNPPAPAAPAIPVAGGVTGPEAG